MSSTLNVSRLKCARPPRPEDHKISNTAPLHGNYIGASLSVHTEESSKSTEPSYECEDCNLMEPTNTVEKVGRKHRRLIVAVLFLLYAVAAVWFFALPVFLVLEDDHAPQAVKREETAFSSRTAMSLLDETFVNRSSLLAQEYYSDSLGREQPGAESRTHRAASWLYEKLGEIPGVERYNASYEIPLLSGGTEIEKNKIRYNIWAIVRATGRGRSDETLLVTTRFVELFETDSLCLHDNNGMPINTSHVCVAYPASPFLMLEEIRYFQKAATWLGKDVVFAFLGGDPYDGIKDSLATVRTRGNNDSCGHNRDLDSYLSRDVDIFYSDLRSPVSGYRVRELDKRNPLDSAPVGPITAALDITKQGGYPWDVYKVHTQGVNGRITEMDLYMTTLQVFQNSLVSTTTRIAPTVDGTSTPFVLPRFRLGVFNFLVSLHVNSLHPMKLLSSMFHRLVSLGPGSSMLEGSPTAGRRTAEKGRALYCYTAADIPQETTQISPPQSPRLYPVLRSYAPQVKVHIKEAVEQALYLSNEMKSSCKSRFGEDQESLIAQLISVYLQGYGTWYFRLYSLLVWAESYVQSIGGFLVGPENPGGRLTQQNVDSVGISIFQSQLRNETGLYTPQEGSLNNKRVHLSLMLKIEDWIRKVNVLEERLHAASRQHLLVSSTEFVPDKELRLQSILLHAPLVLAMMLSLQSMSVVLYSTVWFTVVSVAHAITYALVSRSSSGTLSVEEAFETTTTLLQRLSLGHFFLTFVLAATLRVVSKCVGSVWHRFDTETLSELCGSIKTYSTHKSTSPASEKPKPSDKLAMKIRTSAEKWESMHPEEQARCLLDMEQKRRFGEKAYIGRERRNLKLGLSFAALFTVFLCHSSLLLSNYTLVVFNGLYLIPLALCIFWEGAPDRQQGNLGHPRGYWSVYHFYLARSTYCSSVLIDMLSWFGPRTSSYGDRLQDFHPGGRPSGIPFKFSCFPHCTRKLQLGCLHRITFILGC
eukprot:gb/GECG01005219.1/.p1 GENE.gb/GECG01005219.1/~~gb/GECG01005219.1/.p1  ORF type:complete len:985 (+),score=61.28 gb/GECG01005219.1/:1-2955(+)